MSVCLHWGRGRKGRRADTGSALAPVPEATIEEPTTLLRLFGRNANAWAGWLECGAALLLRACSVPVLVAMLLCSVWSCARFMSICSSSVLEESLSSVEANGESSRMSSRSRLAQDALPLPLLLPLPLPWPLTRPPAGDERDAWLPTRDPSPRSAAPFTCTLPHAFTDAFVPAVDTNLEPTPTPGDVADDERDERAARPEQHTYKGATQTHLITLTNGEAPCARYHSGFKTK